MKIHQIRNATILIEFGDVRLLVDPMLSDKDALTPLRLFKMRGRNPSVTLPDNAQELINSATHCIITHCQRAHFDHLDGAAIKWLRETQLPVFCTPRDEPFLVAKGINILPLRRDDNKPQRFLNGTVLTTPCRHGRGFIGKFMEHGVGYVIKLPKQPSLYLTGDTILTDDVFNTVKQHSPEGIVAPAGGARFDVGTKIIMNADDMITLAKLSAATIIANHVEAISHCPVSRADIRFAAKAAGFADRIIAPDDGEAVLVPTATVISDGRVIQDVC